MAPRRAVRDADSPTGGLACAEAAQKTRARLPAEFSSRLNVKQHARRAAGVREVVRPQVRRLPLPRRPPAGGGKVFTPGGPQGSGAQRVLWVRKFA
jgi:hypothetical protein